ncbi:hypothetical protein [Bifidobacterium vespertilionis]|uniref:hypothetical protein n=1 Tax=Bifidobacterium vespertilionis TaxID=2562524 RepID=UPI001BDCF162|nr:hypothetical protein [Bifidobacterium vespertilionis]MBT1180070.1 hypothetical protein [Bifidobacterium vespertilionis]
MESVTMTAFRRRFAAGVAAATAGALLIAGVAMPPVAAHADEPSASASSSSSAGKDETIYIKAGADGSVSGIYVVNTFAAGNARTVNDPGAYAKVTNLTTDEQLDDANGSVSLTTLADQPFYYQGDLDASTTLPWTIGVTYTLDGQSIAADQLAGKSGDLEISLSIESNAAADQAVSDFADSYVIQAQGTFPQDAFAVDRTSNATLAQAGGNTVVSAMVLPGESTHATIGGKANGFSSSGWQITAMSLDMALDVRDQDTSKLSEQTDKLEDATTQLKNGADDLADGNGKLRDGANALADGLGTANDGASALAQGVTSLSEGAGSLNDGLGTLQTGADALNDGLGTLSGGAGSLQDGASQLKTGADTVADGNRKLADGLSQLSQASGQLTNATSQLPSQAKALSDAVSSLAQGDQQYRKALSDGQSAALAAVGGDIEAAETTAEQAYRTALAGLNPNDPQSVQRLNAAVETMAKVQNAKGQYEALKQTADGYGQLGQGIAALNAAVNGGGMDGSSDGDAALTGQLEQLSQGIADMHTAITQLQGGAQSAAEGSAQLASGATGLASGASDLASGAANAQQGASQLAAGVSSARDGSSRLASGASDAASGASQLASGVSSARDGANDLASGAGSAADGADQLSDGARELADSVKGMDDKVLDELQKTIDDKLGRNFKAHSFVAPENTDVNRVQFTYVLDGVNADDESDGASGATDSADTTATGSTADANRETTFWDRLLALF